MLKTSLLITLTILASQVALAEDKPLPGENSCIKGEVLDKADDHMTYMFRCRVNSHDKGQGSIRPQTYPARYGWVWVDNGGDGTWAQGGVPTTQCDGAVEFASKLSDDKTKVTFTGRAQDAPDGGHCAGVREFEITEISKIRAN